MERRRLQDLTNRLNQETEYVLYTISCKKLPNIFCFFKVLYNLYYLFYSSTTRRRDLERQVERLERQIQRLEQQVELFLFNVA